MYSLHHPSFNKQDSLYLFSPTLTGINCFLIEYLSFLLFRQYSKLVPLFLLFNNTDEVKIITSDQKELLNLDFCFFQNDEMKDCLPVNLRNWQSNNVRIFTAWGRHDLDLDLLWFALTFWFLAKMPLIRILKTVTPFLKMKVWMRFFQRQAKPCFRLVDTYSNDLNLCMYSICLLSTYLRSRISLLVWFDVHLVYNINRCFQRL